MKQIFIVLMLTVVPLFAQQPVVLQPWMQVEGTYIGQRLGSSVGYAGNIFDSTIISVGKVNETLFYHIKTPDDTIPRLIFPEENCSFGDFNGDGIKDLLVSGNPTKIFLGFSPGVFDTIPFFIKHQEPEGYAFGRSMAIGKINGDNYDDLIITDLGYPNENFVGRVYLFLGGIEMDTVATYILDGSHNYNFFGWNVTAGDLNDDGFDDVIILGYDQSEIGPNGTIRFSYIKVTLGGNNIDTTFWSYIKGTSYIGGISSFDCNGDGIDDLMWAHADSLTSSVYIHYGNSNSIDSIPDLKLKNPGIGGLGEIIANGGDLNCDGYDDIVIGAPGHSQDLGFILVYSGGPMIDGNFDAGAGLSVVSRFGHSIVSVGDVNGDGIDDILVGAPRFKWDEYRGKWFIFLGDTNIPVTSVKEENISQPEDFVLFQNFPNPFNPNTTIKYVLNTSFYVTLEVFNLLGEKIKTLESMEKPAGEYIIEFNGKDLSSGVYYYKITLTDLKGNKQTQTKSMVLIK